jgi:cation transport ATPase
MKVRSIIKISAAALSSLLANAVMAGDSLGGRVQTTGKEGFGKMLANAGKSGMDSMPFWEMMFYIGAFIAMGMAIYTIYSWKKSRGQEGDLQTAGVYALVAVLAFAVPETMGNGIATFFGNGAAVVAPSSSGSPSF